MRLFLAIAARHLLARKRQSIVSLSGIILGVAFFLAVSSMMQGSEKDFIQRLIDNSPHITISDEFRKPSRQPAAMAYPDAAVRVRNVQPLTETRGIRSHERILSMLRNIDGVRASPVLTGQGIITFAGRNNNVNLNGMVPAEINTVSTIAQYMTEGSIDDLIANPDGVIVGVEMARRLSLSLDKNITVTAQGGQVRTFKVVGVFRTGRGGYDTYQAFMSLKSVQSLTSRINRINNILVKLDDPNQARVIADEIEDKIGYKSLSWQESSEDLMNTLAIRNAIMYSVVSALLVVAAFGIYNVISTVVMEKQRDIAILKSMGFHAADIRTIFLWQGIALGLAGVMGGLPLGSAIMYGMSFIRFKPPGGTEVVEMPLDWSWPQFAIAAAFALVAAIVAAFLPARKGARLQPVDVLRGGAG